MAASSCYPARACHLLLFLLHQPVYYLWFMVMVPQYPHTAAALSFSYNFSNPGDIDRANLTYLSSNSTAGDGIINLTRSGQKWSTGGVAYRQPVRLWDHRTGRRASFTTDFSFAISANGTEQDRGDGMAFFIGASRTAPPPDSDGAFLGLFSNSANHPPPQQTVGVEFDTHNNDFLDPPGVVNHIGIDVNNSLISKVTKDCGNTSAYNLGQPLSGNMSASIKYDGSSKILSVILWLADGTVCDGLETTVDFKAEGVPQYATVGFSAATGDQVESHQLLSWSFDSKDPSKLELWVVILIAGSCVSSAALMAALLYWVIMHGQRPSIEIPLQVAREFSYRELSSATNNFSKDRMLGEGKFGEVYRGELPDPLMPQVAVKKLTKQMERTRKDYVTEIMTLGQLSHRNLVKLVGWCHGGGNSELLLVYELVTNKSLDEHLHGSEPLLTWSKRYRIVRGIGDAIAYLHTGYRNPILHRDIKPSNVMLDDDFEAKLGDFGFVRQIEPGQGTSLVGTVIGTIAYMDPVCKSTNTVSTASDMYSFGVLLLEIATGLKLEVEDSEGHIIPKTDTVINAVQESYAKGEVLQMADQRLNGDFDKREMERVLVVGLLCVQQQRQDRPKIRAAVDLLSDLGHPVPQILS